ncbi:hypothetical protein MMPV_007940 [Pyropia vietnamensis]
MPAAICGRSGCGPVGRPSGPPLRPAVAGPGGGRRRSPASATTRRLGAEVDGPPPGRLSPLPPSTGVRVAATAAGVATKLLLYPLDSLKVRVQTASRGTAAAAAAAAARAAAGTVPPGGAAGGATAAAAAAAAALPESALRVAVRAVAQGGGGVVGLTRRLYGGLPAAMVGVLPHAWVYMPVYVGVGEALKPHISNRRARLTTAAATAGVAVSLVRVPLDACKKRVQAGAYPSLIAAARGLLTASPPAAASAASATAGAVGPARVVAAAVAVPALVVARVARFYPGWSAAVAYDVPYAAVQLTCLDALTAVVGRQHRRRAVVPSPAMGDGSEDKETTSPPPPPRLSGAAAAVVGAATGAITSLVTEPLDVVRTRAMTATVVHASPSAGSATVAAAARRTPWAAAVAIAQAEGLATLWRGTTPRLVSVTAASAVWYTVYEGVRRGVVADAERRRRRQQAPPGCRGGAG